MDPTETDNARRNALAIVLKYSGASAAEEHLSNIAKNEGDLAIVKIANDLTAAEIAQVTSEADLVKPSLLHTAINGEKFRAVFRRAGVTWSAADETHCKEEVLHSFQEELEQFFCAFILLHEDENRRLELLDALFEETHGLDALVFSVIHEKDFAEFMASPTFAVDIGDWREMIGLIRARRPEQWKQFVQIVTRASGNYHEFVHGVAEEMYAVAVNEGAVERKQHTEADDLFTPLP
jgi:hypothetical protein